jgi:hypothetical protein
MPSGNVERNRELRGQGSSHDSAMGKGFRISRAADNGPRSSRDPREQRKRLMHGRVSSQVMRRVNSNVCVRKLRFCAPNWLLVGKSVRRLSPRRARIRLSSWYGPKTGEAGCPHVLESPGCVYRNRVIRSAEKLQSRFDPLHHDLNVARVRAAECK